MVASDTFAEFLREQLAPLGRVTMRRMFGKTGVFCDGVMLGMVTENTLYFRVDDQNRETFKEARVLSAPQLREEGPHHRPLILARAGAAVRRARRACRVGASSAGGRAPGCGEAGTDRTEAKIEASTDVTESGSSCSWAIARRRIAVEIQAWRRTGYQWGSPRSDSALPLLAA